MKHFILFYDTVPEYLERRGEFRSAHLTLARAAQDRGELVLGGALANPVDGAILLFRGETEDVAHVSITSGSPAKPFGWSRWFGA